jgi:hypothetical protein
VLLDMAVGLVGRYDLVVSALVTSYALHRPRTRRGGVFDRGDGLAVTTS